MRILVAIETWGLIGGSERYAGAVVTALTHRSHRVEVLCARREGPPLLGSDEEVVHIEPKYAAADPRGDIRRRTRAIAPDVILHLGGASSGAFRELAAAAPFVRFVQDHTVFCPGLNKVLEDGRLCDQPLGAGCLQRYFLTEGCIGFKPKALGPLKAVRALQRRLRDLDVLQSATRIVVASQYMKRELVQAGCTPEQVLCVPYFSEPEPAGTVPVKTQAFLEDAPLILCPARLALPDKGVDYLLTALHQVGAPYRCVIAGDGPAAGWLREKAREEGLTDRVHFSGWLDGGQLAALYERAAVVVVPSVWNEPFGLIGLEAMARAKPVVAFDVGGISEWLADGISGTLVRRKDTDEMAAAIDRLLADSTRAAELGQAGQQRWQEQFSLKAHLDALEELLTAAAR